MGRSIGSISSTAIGDSVKFLVDAQLPRQMTQWFGGCGYDAIHTLDLPSGNRTTDVEICKIADAQARVVISKDADFVDSHLLSGKPSKLLLVSTGNLSNVALQTLFVPLISDLVREFGEHSFLELTATGIVLRG